MLLGALCSLAAATAGTEHKSRTALHAEPPPSLRGLDRPLPEFSRPDPIARAADLFVANDNGTRFYHAAFLSVSFCVFRANAALGHGLILGGGGAIYLGESQAALTNTEFAQNSAIMGGAIASSESDLICESSTLQGNEAFYMAGAIGCLSDGATAAPFAYLRNLTFEECHSKEFYGAAFFLNYPDLYIEAANVVSCSAAVAGGGLCFKNSTALLVRCQFIANRVIGHVPLTVRPEPEVHRSPTAIFSESLFVKSEFGLDSSSFENTPTLAPSGVFSATEEVNATLPLPPSQGLMDFLDTVELDPPNASWARDDNSSDLIDDSIDPTFSDDGVTHPLPLGALIMDDLVQPLLARAILLEANVPFVPPPPKTPRGGAAIMVVQEQSDADPRFELLTDNCVFEDNLCNNTHEGLDIVFVGLCRWFSYEDQFSNAKSAAFALSTKSRFCHTHTCGLTTALYYTLFSPELSFPPPPPPLRVAPPATPDPGRSPPPAFSTTPHRSRLAFLTMPPTPTRRRTDATSHGSDSPTPSPRPSPTISESPQVSPFATPPPTRTPTQSNPFESFLTQYASFLDSFITTMSKSLSYTLHVTFLPSNVLVSRSRGTLTFQGNTVTYTVVHYTTWEWSYQAIPTLTLTFADYPIAIITRTHVIIDVFTVVRPTGTEEVQQASGTWLGIAIGIGGGLLLIGGIAWFAIHFSRRAAAAEADLASPSELEEVRYAIVPFMRERVKNPIFNGSDGGSSVDPFSDDFGEMDLII
jgi:hypothetical protein